MIESLLFVAVIILFSVFLNRFANRLGVPILLFFIVLGMLFGSDGIFKIPFDNYELSEQVCSVALIFIIFYGGFGTKWSEAKPIAKQAILLSSLGTFLTAFLVGGFCYFIIRMELLESMLIGAVISSTDAASVFSILRSKNLNLRYRTASLLELESGSNDPFSYMLTIIILSLMNGKASLGEFGWLLISQILIGLAAGFIIAYLTKLFLKHFTIASTGFFMMFMVGIAILAYALPTYIGGNGYLSAYICGIMIGNCRFHNKWELVHFFDGLTTLMQMLLFFLLGLLAFPSQLPKIFFTALLIALFLTLVARPLAVNFILRPFKTHKNQRFMISWAGLRGAASIVFAIMVEVNPAKVNHDVFHIVFFIVIFSILIQGTFIPWIAQKVDMIDHESDVMKTFTDYMEEEAIQFIQFKISKEHAWHKRQVKDINLPPDTIFVLLVRKGKRYTPNGETVLQVGDRLILGGIAIEHEQEMRFLEKVIQPDNKWIDKPLFETPFIKDLVIMIKRGDQIIIPQGDTILLENDVLIISKNIL